MDRHRKQKLAGREVEKMLILSNTRTCMIIGEFQYFKVICSLSVIVVVAVLERRWTTAKASKREHNSPLNSFKTAELSY